MPDSAASPWLGRGALWSPERGCRPLAAPGCRC